jgi:hypothetical protein
MGNNSALFFLQDCNSHEDLGAHNYGLLLGVVGSSDHGLEFLPELDGLGNLLVVVLSH